MLEEMLSRVAASPAVHLDHIIRYFSGMMYNPRVVPSHYKPVPAASHTQNIINTDSFLISHTTQDKERKRMERDVEPPSFILWGFLSPAGSL